MESESSNFDFLLSQYFDGTLSEEERAAVEARLETDPRAAKALSEFKALHREIGALGKMPGVRWDRMAESISRKINAKTGLAREKPAVFSSYAIGVYRGVGLALAASLLIGFAIIQLVTRHPAGPELLTVVGPQPQSAAGAPMIDISVSQPAETTAMAYVYDNTVLADHAVVALDTAEEPQFDQVH